MNRFRCILAIAAAFYATLSLPDRGTAGDFLDRCLGRSDCPRSCYSPFHYWTPTLYHCWWTRHNPPPHLEHYASDRFSDIPPSYQIVPYRCQPGDGFSPSYGSALVSPAGRETATETGAEHVPAGAPPS